MNFCFAVSKNVVSVEDILDMHNFDNTLTEAEIYNASIWCHYIAWALKIHLDNLNEVNNVCTWLEFFTQVCHNMAKCGILKISNVNTVQT